MHSAEASGQATMERISSLLSWIFRFYFWGKGKPGAALFSASNVLSTEEAGIDRPGAWADHGQSPSKDSKKDWNPGIGGSCQRDPHLDRGDQGTGHRGPQPCEDEQPEYSSGDLRGGQACRRRFHLSHPVVKQSDTREQPLNEEAEARPAIREGGEKTLQ